MRLSLPILKIHLIKQLRKFYKRCQTRCRVNNKAMLYLKRFVMLVIKNIIKNIIGTSSFLETYLKEI